MLGILLRVTETKALKDGYLPERKRTDAFSTATVTGEAKCNGNPGVMTFVYLVGEPLLDGAEFPGHSRCDDRFKVQVNLNKVHGCPTRGN